MNELINKVEQWAKDKHIFLKSDSTKQTLKFLAEAGEVADEVAKGNHDNTEMEIGDVLVTLILLCRMEGTHPEVCLQRAYDKISKRKGEMVNGVFVKEGD